MASRQGYQHGSLSKVRRSHGRFEWVLRYRVTLPDGRRCQRQAVVGSDKEYKTRSQAEHAADKVRLNINERKPAAQQPTVQAVASHFTDTELAEHAPRRSWSSKAKYKELLALYILPRWGAMRMMDVKAVQVEAWLGTLMVTRGGKKAPRREPMADSSKLSVRDAFAALFVHAQRYEFVPQGHNPIKLVRQSGKRKGIPDILTPGEIHGLWHGSAKRERAAISLHYGNGLRSCECFALTWRSIDFEKGTAAVNKSIVKGHVGQVKTECSQKLVPLHALQLEDLKAWREVAPYAGEDDWVFGSDWTGGRRPYWPDMILKKYVRPLAKKLGINKNLGWHTFRRTFSSLLVENGENVATTQELLRHANPTTTFKLYAQARPEHLRVAQGKVVEMVRQAPLPEAPKEADAP